MIITKDFVLLAFQKTGTTYTTEVMRLIHARRGLLGRVCPVSWQKRNFPRPGYKEHRVLRPAAPPYHKARMSRHGTYRDIPEQDKGKKLVSIVRNPFDRYTSAYLFQTRMRRHLRTVTDLTVLESTYPDYPNLSFSDYYDMLQRFKVPNDLGGIRTEIELGAHTVSYIKFYFRDPQAVFRKISRAYIEDRAFEKDIADIYFLHQSALRAEFTRLLQDMGYSEEECHIAAELKPRNVADRKQEQKDLSYFYDEALQRKVLQRDALIFTMFPEFKAPLP